MRSFFKTVLAVILGFFLLVVIGVGIVAVVAVASNKSEPIAEKSFLKIDFNYAITERSENNNSPFAMFGKAQGLGINQIEEALTAAKKDPKIKGILLELSGFGAGLTKAELVRNALLDFKKSGKPIYAYAEYYDQKTYYVASVANKIYLNPAGTFLFQGLSIENAFLKGMFDKLGIEMQLVRGKNNLYKGAGETYIKDAYSPENKQQLSELLGGIYSSYLSDVAAARQLEKDAVFQMADDLLINVPEDALKYKLIDKLAYKDEVLEQIAKVCGVEKTKDQKMVTLMRYVKSVEPNTDFASDKIAVIYANGGIMGGEGDDETIGSERISMAVRKARQDEKVKALVIRINSPGGSALASDVIWREIYLAKYVDKKPVVVSMGDYAASGGYYIAAPADSIFAQRNTITGSIGVFALIPNAKKLFNEKFGITFDGVNTTKNADLLNPSSNISPVEMRYIQTSIDKVYSDFISRVAQGRKRDTSYVLGIAGGRVYTGEAAKKLGLVDKIGTLQNAITCAAGMAKLKEYRTVNLPAMVDPFEQFQKQLSGDVRSYFVKQALGSEFKYVKQAEELLKNDRIQARISLEVSVK